MSARKLAASLLLNLLFWTQSLAQNLPVWKFAAGQVFLAERTASQLQTVELNGKAFTQQQKSVWHIRLDVKDKPAQNFEVLATLTKVEQHRSGEDEKADSKLSEKMQGSVFGLEVAATGRIVKLRGYEEFLKRLAAPDRETYSEESLRDALADLFGPLPSLEKSWQREYFEPFPHFGSFRSTATYEYRGTKLGRDMIDYTIRTKLEIPKTEKKGLLRIVKGNITTDKASGAISFDREGGHLIEHERTMLLRGALTIEALERQHPLEFRSVSIVRITLRKE